MVISLPPPPKANAEAEAKAKAEAEAKAARGTKILGKPAAPLPFGRFWQGRADARAAPPPFGGAQKGGGARGAAF